MGLDVYLYHYEGMPEFKTMAEARKSYDAIYKKVEAAQKKATGKKWEKYESLTDAEKNDLRAKDEEVMKTVLKGTPWEKAVGKYGMEFPAEKQIEIDSRTLPTHMFKIGYFRSSYNDGGINNVLKSNGMDDLYGIFDVDREEYNFKPDWKKSLKRVNKVIEDFTPLANELLACHHMTSIDAVADEEAALKLYRAEVEKNKKNPSSFLDGGYSNRYGHFFLGKEPMKIRGMMYGKNCIGQPGMFVITETEADTNGNNWYVNSLLIVKETIEWVLAKPDPENYYFHWSG